MDVIRVGLLLVQSSDIATDRHRLCNDDGEGRY